MFSQRSLKLSFFKSIFSFPIGWFPLFCLPDWWLILLYALNCNWFLWCISHFGCYILHFWLLLFNIFASLLMFSLSSSFPLPVWWACLLLWAPLAGKLFGRYFSSHFAWLSVFVSMDQLCQLYLLAVKEWLYVESPVELSGTLLLLSPEPGAPVVIREWTRVCVLLLWVGHNWCGGAGVRGWSPEQKLLWRGLISARATCQVGWGGSCFRWDRSLKWGAWF